MTNEPQPKWQSYARAGIILIFLSGMVLITLHGLSLESLILTMSPYAIVVGTRTIVQKTGAMIHNRRVDHKSRKALLKAVMQLYPTYHFGRWEKFALITGHDFRVSFRARLWKKLNIGEAAWRQVWVQTYANLGLEEKELPPVYVEVPTSRPDGMQEVIDTMFSILNGSYPRLDDAVISLNDPQNIAIQEQVAEFVLSHPDKRLRWINLPVASKRHAMYAGYQAGIRNLRDAIVEWKGMLPSKNEMQKVLWELHAMPAIQRAKISPELNTVSVNADGDTQLDLDAISLGVLQLLLFNDIVAVTSNVEIKNKNVNFLTKITFARYKVANLEERAYQALFRNVRCMSGPLMIFWTYTLTMRDPRGEILADAWLNETFNKKPVGPGDDRNWTNRLNEMGSYRGFGVSFNPSIYTVTDAPISWLRWKVQQLRWQRSGNRGFVFSFGKFEFQLPLPIIFDDIYLFAFPLLLIVIFVGVGVNAVNVGQAQGFDAAVSRVLPYITTIVVINLLKAVHTSIAQRDVTHMLMALYPLLYVRYLGYLRVISLFTMGNSGWLGRSDADMAADRKAALEAAQRSDRSLKTWSLAA